MPSTCVRLRRVRSRSGARQGAMVKPQLPITMLVTPSATDGVANGSQMSCASKCVCRSMMPGASASPCRVHALGRTAVRFADRGDAAVLDRQAAVPRRRTHAVDQQRIVDDKIVHPLPLLWPDRMGPVSPRGRSIARRGVRTERTSACGAGPVALPLTLIRGRPLRPGTVSLSQCARTGRHEIRRPRMRLLSADRPRLPPGRSRRAGTGLLPVAGRPGNPGARARRLRRPRDAPHRARVGARRVRGYCKWTRVEEIVQFAKRMGFRKIGIANCISFVDHAYVLSASSRATASRSCRSRARTATSQGGAGHRGPRKDPPGQFEPLCNPVSQAELLNAHGCELNVVMGLCVGHDSLFFKHAHGLTRCWSRRIASRPQPRDGAPSRRQPTTRASGAPKSPPSRPSSRPAGDAAQGDAAPRSSLTLVERA